MAYKLTFPFDALESDDLARVRNDYAELRIEQTKDELVITGESDSLHALLRWWFNDDSEGIWSVALTAKEVEWND